MTKDCPFHVDHENRIDTLEVQMKEVLQTLSNHKLLAIVLGFVGTMFSAVGACVGVILTIYLKAGGI